MNFDEFVARIRLEQNLTHEVPGFDPGNGNEKAKFLFLLEAPGARAIKTGLISFENPDPTARNFRAQLAKGGISRDDIALWNIVPWYIGNEAGTAIRSATTSDVRAGSEYLKPLIELMPILKCVFLVGGAARKAHVFLSHTTSVRIVSCHHPSARVMNTNPKAEAENIEIFRFVKATT